MAGQVFSKSWNISILLSYLERLLTKPVVILSAGVRRRCVPEDGRDILGYLDKFGRDDGVEPDQILEQLSLLI